ncbi:MAG: glycosyltransferase, partial [Gemmatimonadales bacterium]
PADPAALAEALEQMLGSPALRTELARTGRRRIEEEFDVAAIAGELVRRFAGEPASESNGPRQVAAAVSGLEPG